MKTIILLAMLPSLAVAQEVQTTNCAPHDVMLATAIAQWHEGAVLEAPAMHGTRKMELLLSKAGTWTVILTKPSVPQGISCIVMEGTDLMLSSEIPLIGDGM